MEAQQMKSENRNPKAERSPNSEVRRAGPCMPTRPSDFGLRTSAFGRRLQNLQLSGIRTARSPSPLPSPSGRGSIIGSTLDNPSGLELSQRGPWFSLSLRERAGVRGNGAWKAQPAGVLQLA